MTSNLPQFLLFFFFFTIFLYLNNHYAVYSHIANNNKNISIQEISDENDNIKVKFAYDQEKININILTNLTFSILNLTTDEHIKNFIARVVVTEGPEVFRFDNIKVRDGDFSVKHSFTNYGSHQVLLRIDTNSSIASFPFQVMIPYQSSPFLINEDKLKLDSFKSTQNFSTYIIIAVGITVSVIMTLILSSILKKK